MISINSISNSMSAVYNNAIRLPAKQISALILGLSLKYRPGLSAQISTANIIRNISSRGIPTEKLSDGSKNLMNIMISCIVDEVYRAIKEDANIQVAISPNALNIEASGGNSGGPVVVNGTNKTYSKADGLMQ